MSDSLRQASRIAKFETPLGPDRLALVGFECTEAVSENFEITIEVLGDPPVVDFDTLIGLNCTITYDTIEHGKRYFDGILTESRWLEKVGKKHKYEVTLRPWFWLTSFRRNCLIFHDKTAPQIIEEIFSKHSFAIFSNRLSRSYPTMEYCVQYRESDMAFVCRLMEQHGISYYFEHSKGEHKLILADEKSTFKTIPGGTRRYGSESRQHYQEKEHFDTWVPMRRFTANKVTLDDYDFKKPSAKLTAETSGNAEFEHGSLEIYDSPGKYVEQGDGDTYARVWIDRERAQDAHFQAEGNSVGCFPGGLFTLDEHPESSQNEEYLILRCTHVFGNQSYRSSEGTSDEEAYEGTYEFVRADKPYAPPIVTEVPRIHGPQTAVVVGNGEIDVDEYGRIKVRFHWDREGDNSMPCRLAQVWSGKDWGGIYIPRVGMEVVVQFLEGDPDQPLVIGTVYNSDNMPPYPLPGDKTMAGIKSKTVSGGGYNELVFEDKAGSEKIRAHAEKDLETTVENNETRDVKMMRTTDIGVNDTLNVKSILKIDAGAMVKVNANAMIELTCGAAKITMLPALTTITVGGSSITLTPASISINSLAVDISSPAIKMTSVVHDITGSAAVTIKAPLLNLNKMVVPP